jgi:Large ribosomal RNA subunit accumulation protein YceD
MNQARPMPGRPWSVPLAVSEVPDSGRHIELVADEPARAAVAKLAGLATLPRLGASFDVAKRGRDGLHVAGRVSATVGQTCVVTLEPIENEIDEPIDVTFAPAISPLADHGGEVEVPLEDAPEPLVGGRIDLGVIATEFLILAVDPYPRKPDAVFQTPPAGDDSAHPFAALAALKEGQGGKHGR